MLDSGRTCDVPECAASVLLAWTGHTGGAVNRRTGRAWCADHRWLNGQGTGRVSLVLGQPALTWDGGLTEDEIRARLSPAEQCKLESWDHAHPDWRERWETDYLRAHGRYSWEPPKQRKPSCRVGAPGRCSPEAKGARWAMWGGLCWMCGAVATCTDHVKPLAKGGSNWPANLRPACGSCNGRKGARWPFPTKRVDTPLSTGVECST